MAAEPLALAAQMELVQADVLLRCALTVKPKSPPLRLAHCGIASLLGNTCDALVADFGELGIRQVQLDSLLHHFFPAMATQNGSQGDTALRDGIMRQVCRAPTLLI